MKPEGAIERLKCMKLFMRIKILDEDYAAYDMAIEALKKQIPTEPLDFGNESYLCPYCKRNNFYKGEFLDKQNYCDYCGQAIKWQ